MDIDYNELERKIEKFTKLLAEAVKAEAQRAPFEMQATISKYMEFNSTPEGSFNTGSKVTLQKGDLARALVPNGKGNITKIDQQRGLFRAQYGIDESVIRYAKIQEQGGQVHHKGKAPYFMFWKAKVTGIKKYAIIGASMLKKGYVTIKARPYMKPGLIEFQTKVLPQKIGRIAERVTQLWQTS